MTKKPIARFKHRGAVILTFGLIWLCAFSRPPSTALHFPRSLVLRIDDTQQGTVYDSQTDSLVPNRFESVITYFGRIEEAGEKHAAAVTAYNDSIRFRGIAPFRLDAFMSRDTLFTISKEKKSAVQGGFMDVDTPMLECLFAGPSLRITFPEGNGVETVEHMKTDCPGGIYKRLDLPRTLGVFILRIPSGQRETGDRWEAIRSCPSYSGLGLFPDLRFVYRISRVGENQTTVQMTCDTTLTNVHVVMPNGEEASVIQNRIHVEGSLTIAGRTGVCHGGEALITEQIHYVRGDSGPDVLRKTCTYRLTLTSP